MSASLLSLILEELSTADEATKRQLADSLRPYLMPQADGLLDARQMAQVLEVHPDTLARWAREKRIWATKVGKEWRFRADHTVVAPTAGTEAPDPLVSLPARRRASARRSVAAIRGEL